MIETELELYYHYRLSIVAALKRPLLTGITKTFSGVLVYLENSRQTESSF